MHTVHVSRLPCDTPRIVGMVAASASTITMRAAVTHAGALPPSVKACQPPAFAFAAFPPSAIGSFFVISRSWSFRERAGQTLRRIRADELLEHRLAAALLVLQELEREVFPARRRDDLEVERRDLVVRRLRRALRR